MNPIPPDGRDTGALGLPPLAQVGLVVRDLGASMTQYAALYGPWQRLDGSVQQARYRGRSADVRLDIAIGHSGPVEIELIQWLAGDSPHREFIDSGREGMHHLQYRVDDATGWIGRFEALGYRNIWYKRWCADTQFAYMERPGDPLIIEFLEMPPGGPGTRLPG
ncbi:MAG: VOC family protein [Proteobacteria bacterium]|nr:VOC family protein [Pseudomonadota bacterium]